MILTKRPILLSFTAAALLVGMSACDTRDKNGYQGDSPAAAGHDAGAGQGGTPAPGTGTQSPGGQGTSSRVPENGQKSDGAATMTNDGSGTTSGSAGGHGAGSSPRR